MILEEYILVNMQNSTAEQDTLIQNKIGRPCTITNEIRQLDDETCELHINNNKGREDRSIFDAKHCEQVQLRRWHLSKENEKGTHYVFGVGGTSPLHRFIMELNHIPRPSPDHSVDHINRNTLDNRLQNLRWATQSEQNENRDKVSRKGNAQPLPDGISHSDLPKYVTYNTDSCGPGGSKRHFFRVEKHPELRRRGLPVWSSSKSVNVSLRDKLTQAYTYLRELGDTFERVPEFAEKEVDKNVLCREGDFVLLRSMMPDYVNFCKARNNRGCKFEIDLRVATPRVRKSTSSSQEVSLRAKYERMREIYDTLLRSANIEESVRAQLLTKQKGISTSQ